MLLFAILASCSYADVEKAFKGDMPMIMPTIKNLQSCEDYRSAKDILRDQKN